MVGWLRKPILQFTDGTCMVGIFKYECKDKLCTPECWSDIIPAYIYIPLVMQLQNIITYQCRTMCTK